MENEPPPGERDPGVAKSLGKSEVLLRKDGKCSLSMSAMDQECLRTQ